MTDGYESDGDYVDAVESFQPPRSSPVTAPNTSTATPLASARTAAPVLPSSSSFTAPPQQHYRTTSMSSLRSSASSSDALPRRAPQRASVLLRAFSAGHARAPVPYQRLDINAAVWALRWSTCGQYMLAGTADGHAYVWKMAAPRDAAEAPRFDPRPIRQWQPHVAAVIDCCWHKSGTFFTASMDRNAVAWSLASDNAVAMMEHPDILTSISCDPNSDELKLVTGSLDNCVRLWVLTDKGAEMRGCVKLSEFVTAVTYSPTGSLIVAGTDDGHCALMDASLKVQRQIEVRSITGKRSKEGHRTITGLTVHGSQLIVSSRDSRLRKYDLATLSLISKYKGAKSNIIRASFSSHGTLVIAASADRRVVMWPASVGATDANCCHLGRAQPPTAAAGAKSGAEHVRGYIRGNSIVGQAFAVNEMPESRLVVAQFVPHGPEGRYVVTADADGRIFLYDRHVGPQ
eukprot:m51a1_g6996 hypothetical protein (459) ;mRNA; f:180536-182882